MLSLSKINTPLAICRLDPTSAVPDWAFSGPLACVTRTQEELSIVCSAQSAPADIQCERDWQALKVDGPLDFSLVGVLAALAGLLAQAGISLFAISTFDTDYILVRGDRFDQAVAVLQQAGYSIR